mgnify:CR=1 FL=1
MCLVNTCIAVVTYHRDKHFAMDVTANSTMVRWDSVVWNAVASCFLVALTAEFEKRK